MRLPQMAIFGGIVCNFDEYILPINRRMSLQYATAVGLALRSFLYE